MMAFLNKYDSLTTKSELDIFSVPSTQVSIENGQMKSYRTISPITSESPLEFLVSSSGEKIIYIYIYIYI